MKKKKERKLERLEELCMANFILWIEPKNFSVCYPLVTVGTSLMVQMVKNPPAMQETWVLFLGWEDPWRRERLPTPVFLGFPGGSPGKESVCSAGDLGSIPGLGRSPGKGIGYPLSILGFPLWLSW